jgi:hypothetical protein
MIDDLTWEITAVWQVSEDIHFLSPFNLFPEKLCQVCKMFMITKSVCLYNRMTTGGWFQHSVNDIVFTSHLITVLIYSYPHLTVNDKRGQCRRPNVLQRFYLLVHANN